MHACTRLAVVVSLATACSQTTPPAAAPPSPTPPVSGADAHALLAEMCPLHVPETSLRTEPVELGGAIVFTTRGDVADLRRRVRLMADVYDYNRRQVAAARKANATMPPATRFVEDVQGGARIVFRPANADTLDTFRIEVAAQADRMAQGQCPMLMPPRPQTESDMMAAH